MRVLITGATEPTGRAVARMLLAAGHEVAGIAPRPDRLLDPRVDVVVGDARDTAACARAVAGCASVIHLAGPDVGAVAEAARREGARVILPSVAGDPRFAPAETALDSAGVTSLLVRTATTAGRRIDADTQRTLTTLLRSPGPHQLLHTDDLERFLVHAATSEQTGVVELAAPDAVTGADVRRILTDAGAPASARGRAPFAPARIAAPAGGFTCGWSAEEVVQDLARGLVCGKLGRRGFRPRKGAFPLPTHLIPSRVPTSDGAPLTSAAPEGLDGEFDDHIDPRFPVHTATNTSEALPGPLTPMTLDLHMGALRVGNESMGGMIALDGVALEQWSSRVTSVLGHHVYINASIGVLAAANMPGWDEQSIRNDAYGNIPDEIVLQPHGKPPIPEGLAGLMATWTAVSRVIATARRYRESAELVNYASRAEALTADAIAQLSDEQLHTRTLLWRDRLNHGWTVASVGVMMTGAATAIHARGKKASTVQVDLQRLESARTMLAVERLAALLRGDPTALAHAESGELAQLRSAAPRFAEALDAELAAIGHRGPGECELSNPTFADNPAMLVTSAARAARQDAPDRPPVDEPASRTARMAVGATVARERARDGVVRYTHCLRLALRERARRLVAAGALTETDDIFYLTLDEAFWLPTDARQRVARRRAERERLRQIRMPDVVVGRWEPAADAGALTPGGSVTGIGVSPGVVEGRVRQVTSLDDDVDPGDILVASVTDTGHTAMFAYAAAVVTDIGGAASHAAIVAREFAIPCVVDTKTATTSLTDGQLIRVDGTNGTVTVIADATTPEETATV